MLSVLEVQSSFATYETDWLDHDTMETHVIIISNYCKENFIWVFAECFEINEMLVSVVGRKFSVF